MSSSRRKPPKLPAPSEEMRHKSALLAQELLSWPDVATRPMFGLWAFYRKGMIFAMLPEKRAFEVPNGVALKEGGKWKVFEVEGDAGIGEALTVLEKAYSRVVGPT
jgi:hypothetical protein